MKQYNHQAIRNLYPNAKIVKYSQETKSFKVYDENENLINIDYAKVETEDNKIISEFQAKKYQRDRKYPELGEQFDLLFKDINSGKVSKDGGFYKAIKAVKDKHPKPSE